MYNPNVVFVTNFSLIHYIWHIIPYCHLFTFKIITEFCNENSLAFIPILVVDHHYR